VSDARVLQALVRQADGNDLRGVLEVGRRTWPETYGPIAGDDYVSMGLAKWWTTDATIPAIRAGRVLVAELDDRIVGMVSVGPQDGHLVVWKIYVLREFQGRRIGSALLSSAIERARDTYDEVWLSYVDGNEGAARFYRRHGFTEVDREPGDGGLPDTVWMSRPVDLATDMADDVPDDVPDVLSDEMLDHVPDRAGGP
jgi:ribosomal protein S18 acetylase RimI-like enzyme